MDYKEALDYVCSIPWTVRKRGPERILKLMELLGNPQDGLKYIHIAGTNGKGSTAAMLSSIFSEAGYKTGLFTSPHLIKYNERMKIDGADISDDDFSDIVEEIKPFIETMEETPTEFEFLNAIAFLWFAREKCDIVILEVGMGGEFDSTNIIKSKEAAVITAIGLDHMQYLGDTVEKIAETKSGIIKEDCDVVLYRQSDEITSVIRNKCDKTDSRLHIPDYNDFCAISESVDGQYFKASYFTDEIFLPLVGLYQLDNCMTVLEVCRVLRQKGWKISEEIIRKGLKNTKWASRFEIVHKNPCFIIDGAHNLHGITAFYNSVCSLFKNKKIVYIIGVLADKDFAPMLELLYGNALAFITLTPPSTRALSSEDLALLIRKGRHNAYSCSSIAAAIEKAFEIAGKNGIICSVGSLYLAGDIRNYVINK